jgi:hypothetical protein
MKPIELLPDSEDRDRPSGANEMRSLLMRNLIAVPLAMLAIGCATTAAQSPLSAGEAW